MRSMSEILFLCGSNERVVIAYLDILDGDPDESINGSKDEVSSGFIIFFALLWYFIALKPL